MPNTNEEKPKLGDYSHLPRGKDFKPLENPTAKQIALREAVREAMQALEREEQKLNGHKPNGKADE